MINSDKTKKRTNRLKRMWKEKIDPNSFPHEIIKVCKECGKKKLCQWQHSFSIKGEPEYRARCIDCQSKYWKMVRTTSKFKKNRNRKRKIAINKSKQRMVDYLGGSCIKCGYNKCLAALTFHHRNPKEKKYALGAIKDNNWKKIKSELDKCDLLCFNCHMEIHNILDNLEDK